MYIKNNQCLNKKLIITTKSRSTTTIMRTMQTTNPPDPSGLPPISLSLPWRASEPYKLKHNYEILPKTTTLYVEKSSNIFYQK